MEFINFTLVNASLIKSTNKLIHNWKSQTKYWHFVELWRWHKHAYVAGEAETSGGGRLSGNTRGGLGAEHQMGGGECQAGEGAEQGAVGHADGLVQRGAEPADEQHAGGVAQVVGAKQRAAVRAGQPESPLQLRQHAHRVAQVGALHKRHRARQPGERARRGEPLQPLRPAPPPNQPYPQVSG